ncbi:nicotinate phosphoribosyltransferase [Campylobacter sp. MIT 99-7217]|uniref:nicotinate phosphoribosyltransferase n=1 Tax=Campylobacter sp. MIT 99-7217 TaxID=535091 RepID=UPI00115C0775|nr:nicotinate phosphoribosyltransferase [Campylobacter sp. MIT 99-7217]TQR30991.1 nicotinate phosphoribosyltransferase [Campylobacter sp. MIT 99-7217]
MSKNLSLLCDFYEFTMAQGYFLNGKKDEICYFDVFFRNIPDNGNFVIVAGLEQIIDFILNLHFDEEDINFFRTQNIFDEEFLNYLKNFKFSGDIYALREGEIAFAQEPLLTIKAKACEAQILETFILLTLNHQSLIATKANRIVRAAKGRSVLEFGSRRAQGVDAAINGARAAFIGGCLASACTLASKLYDISTSGTMAHSWVQMFDNELEAFKAYCKLYPKNAILLVDTYDTLKSGLPNAIEAFKQTKPLNFGIRLDSGDLYALSLKARKILDEAGFKECKIIASGSLDEDQISTLVEKNAPIDAFGVGEKLITAKSSPVLGCVYKLVAIENQNKLTPKIKISESSEKITNPHFKKLLRFFDKTSKKALFDKLYLENEPIEEEKYEIKALQIPIFKNGKLVYQKPNLNEIQAYTKKQLECLDEELLDLKHQKAYPLLLSSRLHALKNELLNTHQRADNGLY